MNALILLTKKISVGIAVTAIPALILIGGLWATQTLLDARHAASTVTPQERRP